MRSRQFPISRAGASGLTSSLARRQGLLWTPWRHVRTRTGVSFHERLCLADVDQPVTTAARPPPSGMSPAYVADNISDLLRAYQTEPSVWSAATFRAAWGVLHKAYRTAADAEPLRAAELRMKDWRGLALANSYAETLHLMSLFPPSLRIAITTHPSFTYTEVEECFVHVGQDVEVRGSGGWVVQLPPPTAQELQALVRNIGHFGADGRGCVANTAHRASVWRGRHGESLGVTLRVGRYVPGAARGLLPLAQRGSLLILSKAGMGKTTLLRDLAAGLAQDVRMPRVTVVDTSNEIGGDGPIPLPYLGRCRRIQVPRREDQGRVMMEVIQNHSPEYLIVDEIATEEEAEAAWSISQRGVHLIGTCHGESMEGLLQNRALNLLVGGAAQAFLSNEERRLRNKTKKTVLERPFSAPFAAVAELYARNHCHVYVDVNKAVDLILDDQSAKGVATVGADIDLDAPLLPHLEKLLARKGAAKRPTIPTHNVEDEQEDSLLGEFREVTDDDGYVVPRDSRGRQDSSGSNPSSGVATAQRADSRGSQRGSRRPQRHKSDDALYKELRGFF